MVDGWQLRDRVLPFGRIPLLMGIVNVTPDSFSDGGQFLSANRAVEHALRLVEEGADLLDIGGESTRPYSEPVALDEELRRVVPVLEQVCRSTTCPVSIDTSKAAVAEAAIAAGAQIINDVTGLEGDPRMLPIALDSQVGVCVMHMRGTPQTMQDDPQYANVVRDVGDYLRGRRDALQAAGIDRQRICLDPGIGFGKTTDHNRMLLRNCGRFHALGCPLLVGHSRKGFLAKIVGDSQTDRSAATIGVALQLARQRIQILRIHDVRPVRHALLAFAATGGLNGDSEPDP